MKTGARLGTKELVDAVKNLEDVMVDSPTLARDIAREAGGGAEPILHNVKEAQAEGGFLPHYHPRGIENPPHVFFEPKGGFGIWDTLDMIILGDIFFKNLLPVRGGGNIAGPVQ